MPIRLPRRPRVRSRTAERGSSKVGPRLGDALLALVSYVPLLLTHRGMVGADTKTYLYLDPAKLLSRSPSLWDPSVGLGTVTHQNIGYLFPMGPYYWVAERIGLPDWVAQRFWLGSIIFLAGLGVRHLLRELAWDGPGVTVASFAYALSPYLLHYIYKHSVILLPFTALPWLVSFTVRSLRHRGWRDPARFALVALASGGVNATSLLLVLLAPAAWVVHAVVVEREITVRSAAAPVARMAALSAATSLWWIAGLSLQGRYGINVLRFTETYRTVANASTAPEVTRGFGYWFFYGIDAVGPWFRAAGTATRNLPAMVVSFAVPTLALAAAVWTRWRYRIFFAVLVMGGMVVSVGAHAWADPSPYGSLFRAFARTDSGLAMRSTPRAIPLVALGMAVFLGAGVAALSRWRPERRQIFAGIGLVLVIGNLSPLWTGRMVDEYLERPEDVPSYWKAAGRRLDAGDRATRALEIPGIEFANYRWGSTVDPITPGLTDRDYAARELVPYGSPASADLMNAVDTPLQDGTFDPSAYAPLLRLLGVGDLVVRNDLEYERFRTPRPRPLSASISRVPGLGPVESFGPRSPNVAGPAAPLLDDLELAIPDSLEDPAAVAVYPVTDALPLVRTVPVARPIIVSGDGAGLVAAAEAGLLDPERLITYSGTVTKNARQLDRLLGADATVVITDSNRKAGRRWGSTKDNDGVTEMADEIAPEDLSDNRLDLFGRDTSTQSVSEQVGAVRVTASGYGNPLTFTPGDRAARAFDGDPDSAWKVGAFSDVRGEWIDIESAGGGPISAASMSVSQPRDSVNRWITRLRVIETIDGATARSRVVELDGSSRTPEGQRIELGSGAIRSIRLEVVDTDVGRRASYQGLSGVGFSEIDLGVGAVQEFIRPPIDLIEAAGDRLSRHRLDYVFRRRIAPRESGVDDEEFALRRILASPTARTFAVRGKARLAPGAADSIRDAVIGRAGDHATASGNLRGDTASRATKAFDADPATAWQSSLDVAPGAWVELVSDVPRTLTIDGLVVVNDGRHSLPASVHLEVDGVAGPPIELDLGAPGGRGHRSPVSFGAQTITGRSIRLVIDRLTVRTSPDWLTDRPVTLPVGIAEVRGASTDAPEGDAAVPTGCRTDLVTIDDRPVSVRLAGTVGDAEAGRLIEVVGCEPVIVTAGRHRLTGIDGRTTGIDVDQLALSSDATITSGTAVAGTASHDLSASSASDVAPSIEVERTGRTGYDIIPEGRTETPYWLVLGQSINDGWHLTAGDVDLGTPQLVNGYANGWLVDPAKVDASAALRLTWAPQSQVWIALALSAAGLLLCLVMACRPAVGDTRRGTQPLQPLGIGLRDSFGAAATIRMSVLVAAFAALGAGIVVGPWWAIPTAVVTVGALRSTTGWRLLRVGVVALVAMAGAYVVAKQWRNDFPLDFDWPQHFDAVHSLTMWAYVLLGVECAVEAVRAGWRRTADLEP